jgi:hypothetical protein
VDVGIGRLNSELEFGITNTTVWVPEELGNEIGGQYHAASLPLAHTLPQFVASQLGILPHSSRSSHLPCVRISSGSLLLYAFVFSGTALPHQAGRRSLPTTAAAFHLPPLCSEYGLISHLFKFDFGD